MRKLAVILLCILLMMIAAGCTDPEEGLEKVDINSVEELYHIRITAGDTVLSGVLYDTETAGAFAAMLPLTVELWHPAPGFARAFDLPERIPRYEKSGYEYELGSLAYWYQGPSIAPIGKITSDVSYFQEYEAGITIEIENDAEKESSNVETLKSE